MPRTLSIREEELYNMTVSEVIDLVMETELKVDDLNIEIDKLKDEINEAE